MIKKLTFFYIRRGTSPKNHFLYMRWSIYSVIKYDNVAPLQPSKPCPSLVLRYQLGSSSAPKVEDCQKTIGDPVHLKQFHTYEKILWIPIWITPIKENVNIKLFIQFFESLRRFAMKIWKTIIEINKDTDVFVFIFYLILND